MRKENETKLEEMNYIKLHEIHCLPHEMRAPGNATIGNTPNKSITQRVAKNTLRPRVGRYSCRINSRILFRSDSDGECFTAGSWSIILAIWLSDTSPKWTPALFSWPLLYCYRKSIKRQQFVYFRVSWSNWSEPLDNFHNSKSRILCIPGRKEKSNYQQKLKSFKQMCII